MFFTMLLVLMKVPYMVVSILIVESSGYVWHRGVSHGGRFGNWLRFPHWVHHMIKYPTGKTRGGEDYEEAGDWTFYLLYFLCCFTVGMLVPFGLLDWKNYPIMFVTASIWGYIGQSYFHTVYHISDHWLHRFQWFQRLITCHDIHHLGHWNYGITFFWFDRIAGTFKAELPTDESELFPNMSEELRAEWQRRVA